jgi:hypothetical protein
MSDALVAPRQIHRLAALKIRFAAFHPLHSDVMSNGLPLIFKRELWYRALVDLSLLLWIPCSIWLAFDAFFSYAGSEVTGYRIITVVLVIFGALIFLGRIYIGDIHLDDDGIGWWVWGRRWDYIKWSDIKVITIEIIAAPNGKPRTQTIYSFYRTEKTPSFHGLRFDDHIPNAEALIDAVDEQVRKHNIPVLDRRGDGSAKTKPYFFRVAISKTEVRRSSLKDGA